QTAACPCAPAGDGAVVSRLGFERSRPMKLRYVVPFVLAASIAGVSVSGQRPAPPLTGGNGTLYIGGYPNLIWIIDEATEKVAGTIPIKTGIPRRLTLSRD